MAENSPKPLVQKVQNLMYQLLAFLKKDNAVNDEIAPVVHELTNTLKNFTQTGNSIICRVSFLDNLDEYTQAFILTSKNLARTVLVYFQQKNNGTASPGELTHFSTLFTVSQKPLPVYKALFQIFNNVIWLFLALTTHQNRLLQVLHIIFEPNNIMVSKEATNHRSILNQFKLSVVVIQGLETEMESEENSLDPFW